jgi:DNA repair protein RadC
MTDVLKQYRIPRQRIALVREATIKSDWKVFTNSGQIFEFAKQFLFSDADRELFFAMMLDSKNRLIGVNLVSQGSLADSITHPRECFKAAIVANSAAIAFAHNHPSGECAPSREDRACTERLVNAGKILGIRVLDHVICGDAEWYSFADFGMLEAEL